MSVENLTQSFVNKVSCGENQNKKRYYDAQCKGLFLEV